MILRAFGAKVASTAMIYGSAKIWLPSNLTIGDGACIGPEATIYCLAPVTVGAFAIISQRAHLCAASHDIEDENFQLTLRPISIGAQAWIAAEAFVGPGVVVGEGAVLGARACAFANLQPKTVYRGNPAVAIGTRRLASLAVSRSGLG